MCAVEMAKWLDLPNWGNAGTSDSQVLDAQAGMEANQITLLAMQAGSNLAHDVGYLDFGLTCSLEAIVMVDEFIAANRRLLGGVAGGSRRRWPSDAIAQAGPGGHFMGSKHTRRHMREVQWRPDASSTATAARTGWPTARRTWRHKARRKAVDAARHARGADAAARGRGGRGRQRSSPRSPPRRS